jgi:hypothetical protein
MKKLYVAMMVIGLCGISMAGEKTYEIVSITGTNLAAVTNSLQMQIDGCIERVLIDSMTAGATCDVSIARVSPVVTLDPLPVYSVTANTKDVEAYPMAYGEQHDGTINSNIMVCLNVHNDALRLIISSASEACTNRVLVTVDQENE